MIKKSNEYGEIALSESVIARVVTETAREPEFRGRIFFSSPTGKIVKVGRNGKEALSFIDVDDNEDGTVNIHIFAVIRFGTSIRSISEQLGIRVRKNVPLVTGREVDRLLLSVTGVKSKKVAKRELEISL